MLVNLESINNSVSHSARMRSWVLEASNNLHHLDSDTLMDLLAESALTDIHPYWAFKLAFTWLKQLRLQEGSVSLAESPAFALLPQLLKELR